MVQEELMDHANGGLALHGFLAMPDERLAELRPFVLAVQKIIVIQDRMRWRIRAGYGSSTASSRRGCLLHCYD